MSGRKILVLGAMSGIAQHTARALAIKGDTLYLAGRNFHDLERFAADITKCYQTEVYVGTFDAEKFADHQFFIENVVKVMGGMDGVIIAFGYLGSHQKAIVGFDEALKIIQSNFTGACSLLTHCANYLVEKKQGFLLVISSVAGDRGRQSNYVYGASKGGLSLFVQGLRNRLYHHGVRVITIKPGYVDTPMIRRKEGLFFVADPKDVGEKIALAIDGRRDVVYLPWFWRIIMAFAKCIPETIFKRLNF